MKTISIFPTFARMAAIASALLFPVASSAVSVNTFTDNGVKWKLSADYVAGSQYIANPPANWSVRFDNTQTGTPHFYCNMTLTGFSYTESNSSRDIIIPATIRWNSGGSYGVGSGPLQFIASGAFTGKDITSVDVPSSILEIKLPCFRNCTHLASITVSEVNKYYSAKDGVLYNHDKTKLLKYPEGKAGSYFEVPKTVTALQSGCLAGTKMEGVRFRGNKPACATNAFTGSSFTGYCPESWGMYKGEIWNGISMYPIPDQCELIDGILWYYRVVAGKAKVESVTVVASDWSGKLSMPSKLAGKTLTDIGPNAFSSCRGLKSISIPKSVTNISSCAFSGCSSQIFDTDTIPGVTLVDGWVVGYANALSGTLDLTGVRGIAEQAFADCSGLSSVTIPDSVANIGANAFSGCDGLIALYVPDGWSKTDLLTQAGLPANCVVLYQRGAPVNESWWEYGIAEGRATITRSEVLVIPSELGGCPVTRIGDSAFEGCTGLTSVTIPDSVTSIGDSTFRNCHNLVTVKIPDSVTSVGDNAFLDCSALATLSVPGSWDGTGMLAKAKVPEGCTVAYRKDWQYGISNGEATVTGVTPAVGNVEIPRELGGYPVTSIGAHAFAHGGVTSVTIPDSVTDIGEEAFSGCGELRTVTIPDSVREIGANAFAGCRELETLYVPLAWKGTDMLAETGVQEDCKVVYLNLDPTWQYTISKGVATVTGVTPAEGKVVIPSSLGGYPVTSIGDFAFSHCGDLTDVTIPDSVSNIGAYAFSGCRSLTSVVFSDNVTSIGDRAFEGCSGLYDTNTISGVCLVRGWAVGWTNPLSGYLDLTGVCGIAGHAFYECGGLTSVTIPDSVMSIGDYAFYACSALTSVSIPDSVTSIGDLAFCDCRGLTSVTIGNSVTNIGRQAFEGCSGMEDFSVATVNPAYKSESGLLLTKDGKTLVCGVNGDVAIPDSVTIIGDHAFYKCRGLTSVTIPDSVCIIGDRAFEGCSSLMGVTIPDSVTTIGDLAFLGCNALYDTTTLPGVCLVDGWAVGWADPLPGTLDLMRVRGIAGGAFRMCSNLTSVLIPDSVTSIGADAFGYCSGLTSVTILGNVTNDWYLYSSPFYNCTNLATLVLGGKMTTIGEYMFSGCIGLTNLMIGNSVKSINGNAFRDCSGLTSVMIPDSVENIGWAAFSGCIGLTNVTIPDSVTSIDGAAFSGCSGLTDLTIGNGVTNIESTAFGDCSGLTNVTIPDSVENIGWAAFSGCIGLTNLTIGKNVKSINGYAFYGCSALTSVTIPDSVTSIGVDAFRDCSALGTLYAPALWKGTSMLADAGLPTGCEVVYRDALPAAEVTWWYSVGNGVATVTGVDPAEGDLAIPAVLGGAPVTSIGSTAFEDCAGLRSVVIPDSVTTIGESAFEKCSGLTNVTIGASVLDIGRVAFGYCDGLTAVSIPDSVTNIGEYAFDDCGKLTSVTIGNNVANIGEGVFAGCTNLQDIAVATDNAYFSSQQGVLYSKNSDRLFCCPPVKTGTFNIPSTVTSIEAWAFSACGKLKFVIIPLGVTYIGYQAFSGCSGLTAVDIPDSVTNIEICAFRECSGLSTIFIPHNVEHIGFQAFMCCTNLIEITVDAENVSYSSENGILYSKDKNTLVRCPEGKTGDVAIPNGVTRIEQEAFNGCHGIMSVSIPDSVESIGDSAFAGSGVTYNYTTIPGVSLVDGWAVGVDHFFLFSADLTGVRGIADGAFYYCYQLASVTIPDNITSIGYGMFQGCGNLESVAIPDSVTNIGVLAFAECSSLKTLVVPDSVTRIEWNAFAGCDGLETLSVPGSFAGQWGWQANAGVPAGCEVVYRAVPVTWQYSVADGMATITGAEPAVGHLAIPSELDGYPVTGIGDYAFQRCSGLTSLDIPDSVTNIGYNAFVSCYNLTSITLGVGVKEIDGLTFSGCSSLTDIQVAEGNPAYASEDGVLFSKDKSVLVLCPGGKGGTFSIPDSVETLGNGAFGSCFYLTEIRLGRGVEKVDYSSFINCFSLTNIQVSDENSAYASEGGVLLSKDKSVLALYPRGLHGEGAIPAGVAGIGECAFYMCNLTSVVIPDSVMDIGDSAFAYSSGLASVDLPEGMKDIGNSAFYNCTSLASVTLPDSLANIGGYAFAQCSGLRSVAIPSGVTNIGYGAFQNCNSLGSITVAPDNAHYSDRDGTLYSKAGDILLCCPPGAKSGVFAIPAGVARIESYAFQGCTNLTSVTLPDSVTSIGRMAFWGCDGVMDTESIPGVSLVDGWVVDVDYSLSGAVELNDVRGIADGAFSSCGLTAVSISASVASIGDGAFNWCDDLTRIDVAAGNPAYTSVDGVLFTKDMKTLLSCPGGKRGTYEIPIGVECLADDAFVGCFWLEIGMIPDSVTCIGAEAFDNCDSVVRMDIPSSVTNIGAGAFGFCNALESVVFPGSVGQLEKSMFYRCSKLVEVRIGAGVTAIGDNAFQQCSALPSLTIPAGVMSVGKDVFDGCDALKTLYVPAAWEGTDMLADAAVPAGCAVVYRDGSEEPTTQDTPVPVAHGWLEENAADILAANGGDYEAAAKALAANGQPVWECYVAGLSTTDPEAEFKVKSISVVDGKVEVEWEPDLNDDGAKADRTYRVFGKKNLLDGQDWEPLPEGSDWAAEGWRFFQVGVKLPE